MMTKMMTVAAADRLIHGTVTMQTTVTKTEVAVIAIGIMTGHQIDRDGIIGHHIQPNVADRHIAARKLIAGVTALLVAAVVSENSPAEDLAHPSEDLAS